MIKSLILLTTVPFLLLGWTRSATIVPFIVPGQTATFSPSVPPPTPILVPSQFPDPSPPNTWPNAAKVCTIRDLAEEFHPGWSRRWHVQLVTIDGTILEGYETTGVIQDRDGRFTIQVALRGQVRE